MSYSPTLGRWMQEDPAGYLDGANLYQFTDGSPVGNTDPTGLSDVTVNFDPQSPLGQNIDGPRAQLQFHDSLFDVNHLLQNAGPQKFLYTYINVFWSVLDLRPKAHLDSADGFYRYYIDGISPPNFEFFMTRHHGQHRGNPDPVDQGTAATDGELNAQFTYVAFCKKLAGFNPPLGKNEQGVASEINDDNGSPNRFQSFPGFRSNSQWFDGNGQRPDGWSDGTEVFSVGLSMTWLADKGSFRWSSTETNEDPIAAKLTVTQAAGGGAYPIAADNI